MRKYKVKIMGYEAIVLFHTPSFFNIVVEVQTTTKALTTVKVGDEWKTVRKLIRTIHHLPKE